MLGWNTSPTIPFRVAIALGLSDKTWVGSFTGFCYFSSNTTLPRLLCCVKYTTVPDPHNFCCLKSLSTQTNQNKDGNVFRLLLFYLHHLLLTLPIMKHYFHRKTAILHYPSREYRVYPWRRHRFHQAPVARSEKIWQQMLVWGWLSTANMRNIPTPAYGGLRTNTHTTLCRSFLVQNDVAVAMKALLMQFFMNEVHGMNFAQASVDSWRRRRKCAKIMLYL